MDHTRRKLLLSTVFGAGLVGLRALATGLPLSLLASPRIARATPPSPQCDGIAPQFLVLLTSNSGDPLNANVPGTYDDAGIYHGPDDAMSKADVMLGSKSFKGAKAWAALDANLRSRASFLHHATYTNAHGDAPKVNKLMGAVKRQEMLVSLISQTLAPCIETVQTQPVVISDNLISTNGQVLPVLNPTALKGVLTGPKGPLARLRQQRDQDLDKLNALFKEQGRTQDRALIDQYALSQQQVRNVNESLLGALEQVKGSTRADLNITASVLCAMKVSPVVVMRYSFGGDNHNDDALARETTETVDSITALGDLYAKLKGYGLQDQVTFALQNVFGRSLSIKSHSNDANGRNHNAGHHATVLIGANVAPGVIGGLKLDESGNDFRARGIDSATGAPNDNGDVTYEDTLAAVGHTIGRAVGVPQAVLDDAVPRGKPIAAALKS